MMQRLAGLWWFTKALFGSRRCRRRKDALLTLLECDCSALPFDIEVGSKKVRSCCQMAHFYLDVPGEEGSGVYSSET